MNLQLQYSIVHCMTNNLNRSGIILCRNNWINLTNISFFELFLYSKSLVCLCFFLHNSVILLLYFPKIEDKKQLFGNKTSFCGIFLKLIFFVSHVFHRICPNNPFLNLHKIFFHSPKKKYTGSQKFFRISKFSNFEITLLNYSLCERYRGSKNYWPEKKLNFLRFSFNFLGKFA